MVVGGRERERGPSGEGPLRCDPSSDDKEKLFGQCSVGGKWAGKKNFLIRRD